ncbi:uncharacterized protein J7T54_008335 [Emericellopsis cladophorae]|uniref:ABC1 atypical kinase-like domain-containing protein n=1 Tax=Emericellopsis cladophorae TaxID=2686198 RepID=A0A9P9Y3H5_9HYPO|nr:uncharacterized protein J7T54_008335 [Emericellopsis cladophorae]KAI6782249.1 hypothetical protein J7T54_008335 [Emericellopsis cladophorae]
MLLSQLQHRGVATDVRANAAPAADSAQASAEPEPPKKKRSRAVDFVEATKRLRWHWKVLIVLFELTIIEYLADKFFLGGTEYRTVVACGTLVRIALDYKLHYGPASWLSRHEDEDLHQRNAQRLCVMMKYNGGLYLKGGQALAMQGSILPREYQLLFGEMFDDAPAASWSEIRKVIEADFGGRSVEDVFGDGPSALFEQEPRAAASIAQVHYARLADGTPVAVKVQRKNIAKEIKWDLWVSKLMFDYTAWSTGLPMAKVGEFLERCILPEIDFVHEAENADKLSRLVADDENLRGRVHVPKVFHELSSDRVLTTEWIDGTQLWDKDVIEAPASRPGIALGKHTGLGLRLSDTMETVLELFAKQFFSWGFVHCDPHPGNILVRQHPRDPSKPQVVLLDHGLYVTMSPSFRSQYARFWKALVTDDEALLAQVAQEWGMDSPEAWADATLMRPFKEKPSEQGEKLQRRTETSEERQQRMIEEARAYLGDEDVFPREMLLLERSITILQGNNRFLGSPVNRIKLLGKHAVLAVREGGFGEATMADVLGTRVALCKLDLAFWWSCVRQYFGYGSGFEQEIKEAEERQMRETKDVIAELLGIVVD